MAAIAGDDRSRLLTGNVGLQLNVLAAARILLVTLLYTALRIRVGRCCSNSGYRSLRPPVTNIMNALLKTAALLMFAVTAAGVCAAVPGGGPLAAPASDGPTPPPRDEGRPGHHFAGAHNDLRGSGLGALPLMRDLRTLDLSAAQSDAIDTVFVRHHDEQRALSKRRRDLRRSLAARDPSAADYATQSEALAEQAGQLVRDEIRLRAQVDAEICATLTPQQLQTLQARRSAAPAPPPQ